jgi:hypothetical protein
MDANLKRKHRRGSLAGLGHLRPGIIGRLTIGAWEGALPLLTIAKCSAMWEEMKVVPLELRVSSLLT